MNNPTEANDSYTESIIGLLEYMEAAEKKAPPTNVVSETVKPKPVERKHREVKKEQPVTQQVSQQNTPPTKMNNFVDPEGVENIIKMLATSNGQIYQSVLQNQQPIIIQTSGIDSTNSQQQVEMIQNDLIMQGVDMNRPLIILNVEQNTPQQSVTVDPSTSIHCNNEHKRRRDVELTDTKRTKVSDTLTLRRGSVPAGSLYDTSPVDHLQPFASKHDFYETGPMRDEDFISKFLDDSDIPSPLTDYTFGAPTSSVKTKKVKPPKAPKSTKTKRPRKDKSQPMIDVFALTSKRRASTGCI